MRRCLLILCLALLAGCGEPAPWRQESYVFGTRVEILIAGVAEARAREAGNRALREFDRLHRAYHAWRPSELSALNEAIAAGRAHDVSDELAALIRDAQHIAAAGDHLFDPGIGRLIALWGFQNDEMPSRVPAASDLDALLAQRPSIAALRVDGRRVSSDNKAVALDFGGYLKGVALDRAAAMLKQDGIDNALINIGGNIMALGSKHGTPWRVGIQHPRPATAGGAPLASIELRDGEAIGTSGDYHRYFEVGGRRYCHLLDPRTGYPAGTTQAVTVLMPPGQGAQGGAGMRSDALSKPIFIAGDDWRTMARRLGVAMVMKVGAGGTAPGTQVLATPAMRARLKIEAPDTVLREIE